ncbi:MAG: DUF366 family protein [Deltaproteobacteria bacterium]|nr:DUF366 family protein [Deltaproteobacteria bacterium]MBI3294365.1 DUF366 family protein [Deltaproteobacteria bacterium]
MIHSFSTRLIDHTIDYDGTQLAPHWIYRQFDLLGDTIVAFVGKANVPISHMVDLEDVKSNAPIYSPEMLHFIGEWFIDSLDTGIFLQHHLINVVYGHLWEAGATRLSRRGNDIYFDGRKLNVSIATHSLSSCLMHLGVNICTNGTPVPTSGLRELGIVPLDFAKKVLATFASDIDGWRRSRAKVLPRP